MVQGQKLVCHVEGAGLPDPDAEVGSQRDDGDESGMTRNGDVATDPNASAPTPPE